MMKITTSLVICCLLVGFPAQAKLRGDSNRPGPEQESRRLMGDMGMGMDDSNNKQGGVGGQGGTGSVASQYTPSPVNVPPAWNTPGSPTGQGERPVTPTTANGGAIGGQSGTPPGPPPPAPNTGNNDGKKGGMGSGGGGGGGVSGSGGATAGGGWLANTPSPVACPPAWSCPPVPAPPTPSPLDSQTSAPVGSQTTSAPVLPTTTAPQAPTPTAAQGERPTFGPEPTGGQGAIGGQGLAQPPTDPPAEATSDPSPTGATGTSDPPRVCPSEYAIEWHPFLQEDSVTKKCETTADCADFEPLGGGAPCCMYPLCVCGGDNAQKDLVKCTDDFFA